MGWRESRTVHAFWMCAETSRLSETLSSDTSSTAPANPNPNGELVRQVSETRNEPLSYFSMTIMLLRESSPCLKTLDHGPGTRGANAVET